MLQRIKNLWKLSGREPQKGIIVVQKDSMRPEEAQKLGDITGKVVILADDVNDINTFDSQELEQGDGKAEFLGEGTTEEFEEQQKEDKGELPWYKRIRNL